MPLSDNMRGAALMAGAMAAFTVNDAFMKMLGNDLPMFQVLFLRGIAASLFLIGFAMARRQFVVVQSRRDWVLIIIRAVAEMAGAWTFITALFHMPIADLSAIMQALPLTITLVGALFLGEAVGWRRLAAILVGLGGVMLIIRPGGDGFTIYSLYAVTCVACVTVRDITSRMMSATVPSLLVAATSALGVTLFAAVGVLFVDWQPVTARAGWELAASVVFLSLGYMFSVSALRVGELSFVTPFRYTSLVVAILLGILFFQTWPDPLTWLGAAIVVLSGLYTLYRERLRARHG